MKRTTLAALTLFSAALISGCGGGTGSSTSASSPSSSQVVTTASVSGAVADGYLVNATVFLDKNFNYTLDSGEPSATTDTNGKFTLNVDAADVGKYPIVAIATKGVTIDKDTNTAVANTYILTLHAVAVTSTTGGVSGTVSNFISPMSTQLNEMMATGKYATIQDAAEALRAQLGMPVGTNMMADYVANGNTTLHTAARNMASLMGSQMQQVIGTNGAVDANRFKNMMGTIYTNLPGIAGTNSQGTMATLMNTMTSNLSTIPTGMTFRNYSTMYRGGMMGR